MAASEIRIRGQEPSDAADLTDMYNMPRVIWGTLQLPWRSQAYREARALDSSPDTTRLVAEIDGKVVGAVHLKRFEGRRAHSGELGMAVHDGYAGRGVGSALMAAVIDLADNWLDLKRLQLQVWADNAPAIALYEKFGFEREGLLRAEGFREGAYVDSLAMARLRGL